MSRILVVDDDADFRVLVRLHLHEAGYDVLETGEPTAVAQLLQREDVDVVVLDVGMPGMTGFEVLEQIRQRHTPDALPVIMLTSRDGTDDVIRAVRLGANDYATKDAHLSVLLQRTRVHLDLKRVSSVRAGPYELRAKIGSGGMGLIYEAEHVADRTRRVAVKILPRSMAIDDMHRKRFLREAEVASRVSHDNVVRVFETGHYAETYYIAMELVDGQNLKERFEGQPVPAAMALDIGRQVIAGLGALHDVGIVHRDIKPHNILLTRTGVAKIADFGIAHDQLGTRYTITGSTLGSPTYAAPEQLAGACDFRADYYGLGATLFFLIVGHAPYPNVSPHILHQDKMRGPPDIDVQSTPVPEAMVRLLRRLMAASPEHRFNDRAALLACVEATRTAVS